MNKKSRFLRILCILAICFAAMVVAHASLYVQTGFGQAGQGFAEGAADVAKFSGPQGLVARSDGTIFVADVGNHVIRMISPAGMVSTIAGEPGAPGSNDGSSAHFNGPCALALGAEGLLYVVDNGNHTIRRLTQTSQGTPWTVKTLVGTAGNSGMDDGINGLAKFYYPTGIAIDSHGNLFVADFDNDTVRKIVPTVTLGVTNWVVTTFAGAARQTGILDGLGGIARFNTFLATSDPAGRMDIAIDSADNLYVTDSGNHTIRKITPAGLVSTFAGKAGESGWLDGVGDKARFSRPSGITVDPAGNIYVFDYNNSCVRKITSGGAVSTVAGLPGTAGALDGLGDAARFRGAQALGWDPRGRLLVGDTLNNSIRLGIPQAKMPSGLVGWWPGEGSAADLLGLNSGTSDGSIHYADGLVGNAFSFDGTGGFLDCGTNEFFNFGTNDFSIEAWVKPMTLTTSAVLVSKYKEATSEGWDFYVYPDGSLAFYGGENWRTYSNPGAVKTGVWSHVAFTRNGADTRIYVNGAQVGSAIHPDPLPGTSEPLRLGYPLPWPVNGLLDEVSIYNRALAANEVAAIFGAGAAGKAPAAEPAILSQPTGGVFAAGTRVTLSVRAGGFPNALAYQWLKEGLAISGATSSTFSVANSQASNAGGYSVVVSNSVGAVTSTVAQVTIQLQTPTPTGLIGWWSGENSGADLLGLNNGIAMGSLNYAAGMVGQAFTLQGGSFIKVPRSRMWAFGTNQFTIEMWVNFANQNGGALASCDAGGGDYNKWIFGVTPTLTGLNFHINGPGFANLGAPFSFETNRWYHVAVRRIGTEFFFSVNGVQIGQAGTTTPIPDSGAPLLFGSAEEGNFLNGSLDEISIYNRALTPSELGSIYQAGLAGKVQAVGPVIGIGPEGGIFAAKTDINLIATAGGIPSPSFQWLKDDAAIAGATASNLIISNAVPKDSGGYAVAVSNPVGSVTSVVAQVKVEWQTGFVAASVPALDALAVNGIMAWGDFDGDGDQDIFIPNNGVELGVLLENRGGGVFVKRSNLTSPAIDLGSGYAASWADYDNDGRLDLLHFGATANSLFRNLGNGQFSKQPFGVGDASSTLGAAWADYDRDGFLDVYVSNHATAGSLYRNKGDGTFARMDASVLFPDNNFGGLGRSVAWGDVDNDGWPDLVVTRCCGGVDSFYHNRGNGTFELVGSHPVSTIVSGGSHAVAWADVDNDLALDLFVAAGDSVVPFRNNGSGTLTRVTEGDLVGKFDGALDVAFADLDNDGDLDAIVGLHGSVSGVKVLLNDGHGVFTLSPALSANFDDGISGGRYVAPADYDGDGNVDVMVKNGATLKETLFRNQGSGGGWLEVRLQGRKSNSEGIGAKVKATARVNGTELTQLREVYRGGGQGSEHPALAHFGLGDASAIAKLRVEWPSGLVTELANARTNQFLTVDEGSALISPQRPVVGLGDTIVLQGSSTLAGPLSYQWEFKGVAIAGATNSYLVVKQATAANAGEYRMRVASGGTEVFSLVTLTVTGDLRDGLVAYWNFDGTYSDQSGLGNNGVPAGNVAFVPGRRGSGLHFNGNGTVQVPASASLNVGLGQGFTYEMWISPETMATPNALLVWNADHEQFGSVFYLHYPNGIDNGSGQIDAVSGIMAYLKNGAAGVTPGPVAVLNRFQHVATTYDKVSGMLQIYHDGRLVYAGKIGSQVAETGQQLNIGSRPDAGYHWFVGTMDEVKIYNRAISQDEIMAEITRTQPYLEITNQPAGANFAAGSTATLTVGARGFGSLEYQWLRNGVEVAGATNSTLRLTNVQPSMAGSYSVRVKNPVGVVASDPTPVQVFTPLTRVANAAVDGTVGGLGASAVDYDGDGNLDVLFTGRISQGGGISLFRNGGNANFVRQESSVIEAEGEADSGVWGDLDNDGLLDLILSSPGEHNRTLFRSNGGGAFTRVDPGLGRGYTSALGDLDNDGWVDVAVTGVSAPLSIYRNLRNGGFGSVAALDIQDPYGAVLGDFDNDGRMDAMVANYGVPNVLYRNDGTGALLRLSSSAISTTTTSSGAAWGDFDNDGDLDLAIAGSAPNFQGFLFRNDGTNGFTRVANDSFLTRSGLSPNLNWVDYDNDGFLDLFLTSSTGCRLYRNNGDGTFRAVAGGPFANDSVLSQCAVWGDFNRDGFLDVAISGQPNRIYLNGGNSNRWLHVQCVGKVSNRSAIGAKVRLQTTIGGQPATLMREVSGGVIGSQNLEVYFGLGDATNVESLTIDWPSGLVTTLTNVAVNQLTKIMELPEGYPVIRIGGKFSPTNYFAFTNDAPVLVTIESSFAATGEVHFTTNGAPANVSSDLYTGPFYIQPGQTVNAYATDFEREQSADEVRTEQIPFFTLTDLTGTTRGGMAAFDPAGMVYLRDTMVKGVGTNAPGWSFERWEEDGVITGFSSNTTITMDRSKSVRAVFGTPLRYSALGGSANGEAYKVPLISLHDYGSTGVVSAIPAAGKYFVRWNLSSAPGVTTFTNNPLILTITNTNMLATAVFASPLPAGTHALTVLTEGQGTVTRSAKSNYVADGTLVTLAATAAAGSQFVGWFGTTNSTGNPFTFAMPAAQTTITGVFTLPPVVRIVNAPVSHLVNTPLTLEFEASDPDAPAGTLGIDRIEITGTASGVVHPTGVHSSFTFTPTEDADYGFFVQAFDTLGGSSTTAAVIVRVMAAPRVVTQLLSQRVPLGMPVSFAPEITGREPISYQWQHNGTNLPGKVFSSLSFDQATVDLNGTYQVFITNQVGSAASELVTLTVVEPGGLLREVPLGYGPAGQPAVARDGSMFVSLFSNKVEAYSPTGAKLWDFTLNDYTAGPPALGVDETVYVGASGSPGRFYAIDPANGAEKWHVDVLSPVGGPAAIASDETIYLFAGRSLFAYNRKGSNVWEFVADNQLGKTAAEGNNGPGPTIGLDGTIYGVDTNRVVYAVRPNGTLKWKRQMTGSSVIRTAVPTANGVVLVAQGGEGLLALDVADGTPRWLAPAPSNIAPSIGPNGSIITGTFGSMQSLNPTNGAPIWNQAAPFSAWVFDSPAIGANGYVYTVDWSSVTQQLRVLRAGDGSLVRTSPLPPPGWASGPTLTKDGLLYLAYGASEGQTPRILIYVTDSPPADTAWPMWRKTAGNSGNAAGIPGDFRFAATTPNNPSASAAVDAAGRVWTAFGARLQEFVGSTNTTIGEEWLDETPVVGPSGRIFMAAFEFYDPPTTTLRIYDPSVARFVAVTNVPGRPADYATVALGSDETMYVGVSVGQTGRVFSWNGTGSPTLVTTLKGMINQAPVIYPDGSLLVSVMEEVAGFNQGRLYKVGRDGSTNAFALPIAEEQGNGVFGGPIVGADGTIYFADLFSAIFALDSNLQVKWQKVGGADRPGYRVDSSPAIGPDETVYFLVGASQLELVAYRPDGSSKWSAPFILPGGYTSYSSMAIGSDNTIYVAGGEILYAARDAGDHGEMSWKTTLPGQIYASPLLAPDGNLYFTVNGGQFISLKASSGPANSAWPMFRGNAQRTANSQPLNHPPTIAIKSPAENATFTDPANVLLQVNATDDHSVAAVQYFDGDTKIGSALSAPFSATLPFAVGPHAIKAQATDDQGVTAFSSVVNFTVQAAKPSITKAPVGGLFARGTTVQLSVEASGTAPFAYQWLFNGVSLDGKTNATLTITNAQIANSGKYSVRVSNSAGNATSGETPVTIALLAEARDDVWMPNGTVNAIAVGADKVYIGGAFTEVGARTGHGALLDFTTGLPDSRFARVDSDITAVAADGNGGWFIGGSFANVGGVARQRLAHVLAGGVLDTNWTVSAQGGAVRAIVRAGSRLYLVGNFTSINNTARAGLAAVTTVGVLEDWTVPVSGTVSAMVVTSESVYIGGDFAQVGGKAVANLARISISSGGGGSGGPKVDDAWNPAPDLPVSAIVLNGGKLIVGGQFSTIAGADQPRLASIDVATGAADTWNVRPSSQVRALAVNGNTLWVGGDFATIGGQSQLFLARLDAATGVVDSNWKPTLNSSVRVLGAFNSRIYAGGQFTIVNGQAREHAAAFEADGSLATWNPYTDGDVLAFAFSNDGVFAGGSFNNSGRRLRANLAAFDLYTGQVADWNADTDGEVFTLGLNETNLWAGGKFHLAGGVAVSNLVVVDAQAVRTVRSAPAVDGPVDSLSLTGKVAYFGGAFGKVNGQPRANVAAYDLASGAVLPWAPVANGEVRTVVLDGSRVYLAGAFTTLNGLTRKKAAAVDALGLLLGWNPGGGDDIFAIAPQGTNVFVGGAFSVIGNVALNRLAEVISTSGQANSAFNAGISVSGINEVRSLFLGANRLLVGGTFTLAGGLPRTNLASFNLDSNPPAIGLDFLPNPDGTVLASAESGHQVFVGGKFQNIAGLASPYFAILGPSGPPVILTQPVGLDVQAGVPVSFAVEATGQEPLRYQWLADGTPLPGATNATFGIEITAPEDTHTYQVQITNRRGQVVSADARLNVLALRPHFADNGTNIVTSPGVTITLSHTIEGTPPFTYQWRRNGINIDGQTGPQLQLVNVTAADSGGYTLVVANAFGAEVGPNNDVQVVSSTQRLKGKFGDRQLLGGVSGVAYGDNDIDEEVEDGEPDPLGKISKNSQWISWTAPASGIAHVTTRGSSFDTLLGVYTGNALIGIKEIAEDDDSAGFGNSELYFNAITGTTYQILVSGFGGAKGHIVLSFDLMPGAHDLPTIVTPPYGQVVGYGQQATLLVEATNVTALTYQWYRNNDPVAGAVTPTLVIPAVTENEVGTYWVKVFNTSKLSVSSQPVRVDINGTETGGVDVKAVSREKFGDTVELLTFGPPTKPSKGQSNSPFGASPARGYSGYQIFDNVNATKQPGEPNPLCSVFGNASMWYLVAAETNGTMRVSTEGSNFDTYLVVFQAPENAGDWGDLTQVACDRNSGADHKTSVVEFQATKGTTYQIMVDGENKAKGTVQLRYGIQPTITQQPANQTVAAGGTLTLQVSAPGTNTYQWLFNNAPISGKTNSTLLIAGVTTNNAGQYKAIVSNYAWNVVSSIATVTVVAPSRSQIQTPALANGSFQMNLTVTPGIPLVIDRSTNLPAWIPIYTNTPGAANYLFSDPVISSTNGVYYRARQ